jgi:hypothetical protein
MLALSLATLEISALGRPKRPSAVANFAWLSVWMIGSDAPRGRNTANQLAVQNPQTPAHGHWPDLTMRHMLSAADT